MGGCRSSAVPAPLLLLFLLLLASSVKSQPLAPNVSSCHLPLNLPSAETPFSCCAPFPTSEPSLFRPNSSSSSSSSLRIRRPAHLSVSDYASKLTLAYSLMKSLPSDDPRSFTQQANIHCAYCNTVYNQNNSSQVFQVHGSWLFFPFHRWYLYFHERILASLLGDDTFALPYWNYDHPDGAEIPWIYSNITSLSDARRNPSHVPPTVAAIDYNYGVPSRDRDTQLRENAAYVYRAMVRDAPGDDKYEFFGQPYRRGDNPMPGYGTVEEYPHNTLHVWSGSDTEIGGKDMGSFYAAARDPIFYAHHAELDRLWDLWVRELGNSDIDDEDYLDSEFVFYNEDAEMVRVKVRDSLNTTVLGYVYEMSEMLWLDSVPVRLSSAAASIDEADLICTAGELVTAPCSLELRRDLEAAASSDEEHLVIVNMTWSDGESATLNVFLNLPSANANTTSGSEEFVAPVMVVPQFVEGETSGDRSLPVKRRMEALNLTEEETVVVTLVPLGTKYLTLDKVFLRYSNSSEEASASARVEEGGGGRWRLLPGRRGGGGCCRGGEEVEEECHGINERN